MAREKKFIREEQSGEFTVIRIPGIEGTKLKMKYRRFCDVIELDGLPARRFYFTLWIEADEDGRFLRAKISKTGGGDEDSARGGEWYAPVRDREISIIGNHIIREFVE